MKNLSITFVLFLMLGALFTTTDAGNNPKARNIDVIIDNLAAGILAENDGLRISSAYTLGQLIDEKVIEGEEASKTLVPLLKMLNNGKTEEEKIVAALSLYKINNETGIYQLRGAARFDNSDRVKKICKCLYFSYHNENGSFYFCDF